MTALDKVYTRMIEACTGDPRQIQHFVKVHSFAALIGRLEGLDAATQFTLELAAYVHDIGVKPAMERYGSSAGPYQEELGQAPARALLTACGIDSTTVERVVYLVGRHHTFMNIDGPDYQILVEADFLVNLYEGQKAPETVRHIYDTMFKTTSGRRVCAAMFGLKA